MKRSLNLMSEQARKRELVRNCLRLWMQVLGVLLVLYVSIGLQQYHLWQQAIRVQEFAQAEYEPTLQIKLENKRIAKEIEVLKHEERLALALADSQPLLNLVGLTVRAMKPLGDNVYLKGIAIERIPILLEEQTDQPTLAVQVHGIANAENISSDFAEALREMGPFTKVKLNKIAGANTASHKNEEFEIVCITELVNLPSKQ